MAPAIVDWRLQRWARSAALADGLLQRGDIEAGLSAAAALWGELGPVAADLVARTVEAERVGVWADPPDLLLARLCASVALDLAAATRVLCERHGDDPRESDTLDIAIRATVHSIALLPSPNAHYNLGRLLLLRGERQAALGELRRTVELDPTHTDGLVALGGVAAALGRDAEAMRAWRTVIALGNRPGVTRHWQRGIVRLMLGDYLRGWADYEGRFDDPAWAFRNLRRDFAVPRWDGSPCDGIVYVHAEQGLGDMIQMLRLVPRVMARCAGVVVEVPPTLQRYARLVLPPQVMVVTSGEEKPRHDRVVSMLSLPYVTRLRVDTIPPPLDPGPMLAHAGRREGGVGICWKGSFRHFSDQDRSASLDDVRPLADAIHARGGHVQSLQYGEPVPASWIALPEGDYLDTARTIASCERVVTVDTSIAHMAGSLGVPTDLLLPRHAEWRWMLRRDDSPWYPSLRLHRQSVLGDWRSLINALILAL